MANVLNRTTKQLINSANTPDFPVGQWIINPDLTAVSGQPIKYWSITGDTVTLLNQAARDAVDAAILTATRDATAAAMDQVENYSRAFALVLLDELNLHTTRFNAVLSAIDNGSTLAAIKTSVAAIVDIPQRTVGDLKTGLRNKLGT